MSIGGNFQTSSFLSASTFLPHFSQVHFSSDLSFSVLVNEFKHCSRVGFASRLEIGRVKYI